MKLDARIRCFAQITAISTTCAIFLLSLYGRSVIRMIPWAKDYLPYFGLALVSGALWVGANTIRHTTREQSAIKKLAQLARATLCVSTIGLSAWICCDSLIELSEERIHFLKYGVLGLALVYSQQQRATPDREILALTLAAIVGLTDENLQRVIPERFFDPRDILLNISGSLFGVILAGALHTNSAKAHSRTALG